MEQKEWEVYMAKQIAELNHQSKVDVAQHWHDLLMESLKGDTDFEASYQAFLDKYPIDSSVLEKPKPIKLSNPEKLATDYPFLNGDSIKIHYLKEDDRAYYYLYKVISKTGNAGEMRIMKEKKYDCVYVEFEYLNGNLDSKRYEMDEFSDFQKFMGLITAAIYNF
jgi:hypothetical protein